jgi:hypothetical protein
MFGLFFKTIGRKIVLAIGLPLVLGLACMVELTYRRTQDLVRQNAADEAVALGDMVATSFTLFDNSLTARPPAPTVVHRQVTAAMQADFRIFDDVAQLRVIDAGGVVRWSRRVEEVGTRLAESPRLLAAPPQGATDAARGEYVRPLGGMGCARCHAGDAFRVGAVQAVISRSAVEEDVARFYQGALLFLVLLVALLSGGSGDG